MRLAASAVAKVAETHGIEAMKPLNLKNAEIAARLVALAPDVMVVAAYGLILPAAVLAIPRLGCLNIHASLLPRWRGAAPIQRAILAGDALTGVTIMRMDAGLDTGPMLLERSRPIEPRETAGELTDALANLGAEALVETLARIDDLVPREQDGSRATYANKISRSDARIDWAQPSEQVQRHVRAFNPVPGAEAQVAGETLKIWKAEPCGGSGQPGEVLISDADRLVIACGDRAIALEEVQRPGGKRLGIRDFLRGTHPVRH